MTPALISDPTGDQLLNQIDFRAAFIAPAISLLQEPDLFSMEGGPYRRRIFNHFAIGMLMESVGWLQLGGAFGYFNVPDVWGMLESIRARHLSDMMAFAADWGYLWDPVWLGYLTDVIQDPRQLKPPFQLEASEQELGFRLFEAWYTRGQELNRSSSASHAITVLGFDQKELIQQRSQRKLSLLELVEAAAAEKSRPIRPTRAEAESPAPLFVGFSRIMDFVTDLHELSARLTQEHTEHLDLVRAITTRAIQLLRWRFFFLESPTDLNWFLDPYIEALGVKEPDAKEAAKAHFLRISGNWRELSAPPRTFGHGA